MISLDVNGLTFVIQLLATAALFIAVKIFFAKPMKNFMAKRDAYVQAYFDEAEKAINDAELANEEAQKNIKNAQENAHQIVEAAQDEADLKYKAVIKHARREAESEMEKAQEAIKRERQSMYDEAKKEIAQIATAATEKLIKKEIDEASHADLFAEFVELVGGSHE